MTKDVNSDKFIISFVFSREISELTSLLIFPPAASATYVPLGISTLKAYIEQERGPGAVKVLDLNIRFWNLLADSDDLFSEYRSYLQGKKGCFNTQYYQPYLSVRRELSMLVKSFLKDVSLYLDTGFLSERLKSVFSEFSSCVDPGYRFLGFSCLFPDQFLFTLGFTKWLKQSLYANPIFIGGAASVLCRPEELLEQALWIDGLIIGEGELPILELIDGFPPERISGFVWRSKEKIVRNPKPETIPLSRIPLPDFSWADMNSYFNPYPFIPGM